MLRQQIAIPARFVKLGNAVQVPKFAGTVVNVNHIYMSPEPTRLTVGCTYVVRIGVRTSANKVKYMDFSPTDVVYIDADS